MKKSWNEKLVKWFEINKRDLPWRKTKNPYYIWISEVMLQQTQVDTVIPYYERFIQSFPSLEALANASEESVLKHWEGLGYYSRARNLQKGAKQVIDEFGGVMPKTRDELEQIAGIGPYTAGAILSIAYGIPEHAVDGNVMRVYSRLYLIEDDISRASSKKVFEEKVMETIHKKEPSSFNQGLMEIGATVCKPKGPNCKICPLCGTCLAYQHGVQENFPVKLKKQTQREVPLGSFFIKKEKQYLLVKRPSEGLLGNLWEFPNVSFDTTNQMEKALKERFNTKVSIKKEHHTFTHIFSHLKWLVTVYETSGDIEIEENEEIKWVELDKINLPLTKATLKMIEQINK